MRFDSYHPAINFIFFSSVITFSFLFTQPVFLMAGYLCAFIYSSYLGRYKALILNIFVFAFIIVYALYYSSYNHFGVTNLAFNWVGNAITLESVYAGFVKGIHLATGAMWFYCTVKIVSSDKVIYLLGKIWPRLSLFVSIFLRFAPQIAVRFARINTTQTAIGRGIGQGNLLQRAKNLVRVISIVITWSLENFVDSGMSMKSRGYTLKGRTAYSLYRFDNRDRSVAITMFFCLTVTAMGIMLDQTKMQINPQIILYPITELSYVFYGVYIFYCLLPMLLQIYANVKNKSCRNTMFGK
ncbi:MAG: energy-coupling factor transporter transmembrane protein EcfT [Oscillospiraceae bacterium]|nr:energy-coupling factor transporter transmembrane protein EcfT [Oscillospiraceae bacterium]